ncbi:MAG: hypothetical protein JSS02_22775 [Planctomycetes bacterium]|nr:hypothetical protein [Planctomycetota bacterium]
MDHKPLSPLKLLAQIALIVLVAAVIAETVSAVGFVLSTFWNEFLGIAAGAGFIWWVVRMFNGRRTSHPKPPLDAP